MRFNGYKYLVSTKRGDTTYYQCSTYRSSQCKGKLIVKELSESETEVRKTGQHTCRSTARAAVRSCEEEMRGLLEEDAITSMPTLLDGCGTECPGSWPTSTLKKPFVRCPINFIKYVRRQEYGGDEFRVLESEPTACVSEEDDRSFVQFNVFYTNDGKRDRAWSAWAIPTSSVC
ncbi:hypothetical protein PHMEG_00039772 [Phytophthora megakarya]|uniref:FLYWCH-type domain-containing protein n=1 Tax=Phytophthora megakarya TaxID=4795 RepID=A0A225UEW3_9STRA|nr:hypothetical protein PHMEG_00039772 [Phytophthora megakarya]